MSILEVAKKHQNNEFDNQLELAQALSTPSAWASYYVEEPSTIRRALQKAMTYFPDLKHERTDQNNEYAELTEVFETTTGENDI